MLDFYFEMNIFYLEGISFVLDAQFYSLGLQPALILKSDVFSNVDSLVL